MFRKSKFKGLLNNLNQQPEQTVEFGLFNKTLRVTSNAKRVSDIYNNRDLTRSALARRIVEQQGALHAAVSQEDAKALIKRTLNKPVMNNKKYQSIADKAADQVLNRLNVEVLKSEPLEVYHFLYQNVAEVFIEDLIGVKLNSGLNGDIAATRHFIDTFEEPLTKLIVLNYTRFLPLWFKNLFAHGARKRSKSFEKISKLLYAQECDESLLLGILKKAENDYVLTHNDVLGEIRAILIGANTVAVSLMWSLYLLSEHPEHVTNIRENEDHARMVYMESLRIYPPFYMQSYEPKKQSKCPMHIFAKTTTEVVSIYNLHHSHHIWEDPESFKPDRFRKGVAARQRGSYVPFGGGSRACPGSGLAMFVGPKVLQRVVSSFSFKVTETPIVKRRVSLMPEGEKMFFMFSK